MLIKVFSTLCLLLFPFFGCQATAENASSTISMYYNLPNSSNIINVDPYTVHSVTNIGVGSKPWWSNLPPPANKIFLDDGSAWEIEGCARGVYGNYLMATGDAIVVRVLPQGRGDSYSFILEDISTRKCARANILQDVSWVNGHQYVIETIVFTYDDPKNETGRAVVTLHDDLFDTKSLWETSDVRGVEAWGAGEFITIGSDESSIKQKPKHILINGSQFIKTKQVKFVRADLIE